MTDEVKSSGFCLRSGAGGVHDYSENIVSELLGVSFLRCLL